MFFKTRQVLTMFLVLIGSHQVLADDLSIISQNITSTPALVTKGKEVFTTNCATCHGPEGKGDGPAAAAFTPKPRNFTTETFKQGSAPSQIFYTVTHGLGSMPSFASMPLENRMAVIHYIYTLTPNKAKDTPESLAKIGLDLNGTPLAGFKGEESNELPVEFIMERMASDGNPSSLDIKKLADEQAKEKAQAQASATPVPLAIKPDLARGEVLFTNCKTCHGPGGEGSELAQAPQIAGQNTDYIIAQIRKFQMGIRGAHPDDETGLKMRPMSRVLTTEEDVTHVANYVHQLPPLKPVFTLETGNAEKGKTAFALCSSCHGADAHGIKALNTPSLRHLQDWYVVAQIKKFKTNIRGSDPRDTNGPQMKGIAMTIPDDQTVKDIMAYIQTLDSK